jgi:hypothetical protein
MSENWITDYCASIHASILIGINILFDNFMFGWTFLKNYDYNKLAVDSLVWYSEKAQYVKDTYNHIYDNYPLAKSVIDFSCYYALYLKAMAMNYKIEPRRTNWICTSVLLKSDWIKPLGMNTNFIEMYEFVDTEISSANKEYIDNLFIDCFNKSCDSADSIAKCSNKVLEVMVTLKRGEQYVHYVFNKSTDKNDPLVFPLLPSKTNFLSVEYTHPGMAKGIVMDLGKNIFYSNNEILSQIFVRRWLEYQPLDFKYDSSYIVKIMDSNIKTVEMTSDQKAFLYKADYKIV